ncbi:MAG: permease [Nanoarchaeota archaeon]|nr:permease [Nanoarchaeota archaeon]MBU1030160.1 permease [Nanoarchaeota archaeon]MBU1849397.1 permease [Nanoarchaeota archaeon]
MLTSIVDWFLYVLLDLNSEIKWVQSLNFFIYDSVKIIILLFLMISIVGFLRTYIPPYKVKNWLSKRKHGVGNLLASIFGMITPFCSCSSIPMFLGFLEAGVPLGITFSFLITSPLVNEYLVVLMLGFFGWKITLLYILSGLLIGTFSGLILGKMNLERFLEQDIHNKKSNMKEQVFNKIRERLIFGLKESKSILKKLWLWILVGVGIGALIHNYIPRTVVEMIISKGGIWTVPIAVILGVPMYGSCAAIVPIAVALFRKGIPLGTALAFMMATSALSFPEAVILRSAMKLKLIGIFFLIVTIAIIITGYLFNLLQLTIL